MTVRWRTIERTWPWIFLVCFLAGCSDDGTTDPARGRQLSIISGAGVTDTISTTVVQELVAQVLNKGKPQARVEVHFEARFQTSPFVPLRIGAPGQTAYTRELSLATDAAGRASVRVNLGAVAGTEVVVVTAPLYGLVDTVKYTVLPGNAVRTNVSPRDTILAIGASFTYRGSTLDRAGNVRTDAVTFESSGTAAEVTSAGRVTATQPGSQRVLVIGPTRDGKAVLDSAQVFVLPVARLAATAETDQRLQLIDVSGRNSRFVQTPSAFAPVWAPSGDRVAASSANNSIAIIDTLGKATILTPRGVDVPSWPDWSADGSWIYFDGRDGVTQRIYRMHPDGTGLTKITPGYLPSVSPDGQSLVYNLETATLAIVDLNNFAKTRILSVGDGARMARWSPDGQWIAYRGVQNAVFLIHPDGTDRHRIGPHGLYSVNWSPDSRFLVGHDDYHTTIVDAVTGAMAYLPFLADYTAWNKR